MSADKDRSLTMTRRQVCTAAGVTTACALLPVAAHAWPVRQPQLSPKVIEARALVLELVARLRKATIAMNAFENRTLKPAPPGPEKWAHYEAFWKLRDEEKSARNALHMAITGGVCIKPQSSDDCDEQHRLLRYLDDVHPGTTSHSSTHGLASIIEDRRARLTA